MNDQYEDNQRKIQIIMNSFNFKKVHAFMVLMGIKFSPAYAVKRVPGIDDLEHHVFNTLQSMQGSSAEPLIFQSNGFFFMKRRVNDRIEFLVAYIFEETAVQ